MDAVVATAAHPRQRVPRLLARYLGCRRHTLELVSGLSDAELALQTMPDAQPILWQLAHTSWFFEATVLECFSAEHRPCSRYDATPAGALAYRNAVDGGMTALLLRPVDREAAALVELAIEHEQQHQECMLADLLRLAGQRSERRRTRTTVSCRSPRATVAVGRLSCNRSNPNRDKHHA